MKLAQSTLRYFISIVSVAASASVMASGLTALGAQGNAYTVGALPTKDTNTVFLTDSGMSARPDSYLVAALDSNFKVGVAINAPSDLHTKYDPAWSGRLRATKPGSQALNFNPSVSYQINDDVSVGAGINYFGALASGTVLEKEAPLTVNDSNYGYNLGTLITVGSQTRVGLSYRTQMKYSLIGADANASGTLSGAGGMANAAITTPDTFASSVVYQLNPQIDLLADVAWSGWGAIPTLDVLRGNSAAFATPENRRNSWHGAVGAMHRFDEQWTTHLGLAYDQTPVSSMYRTAQLADQDRTWFALGGQYKLAKDSALDFGYTHLFLNGAGINQVPNAVGTLLGASPGNVNIYSLQYGHNF